MLEAGSKTIEQIYEDAQKEVLRVKHANMTPDPPPSRRRNDSSDQRRMGRGKDSRNDRGRQDQDWNNVPSKAAKIQEKVDPSKLKLSKVCNTISIYLLVVFCSRLTLTRCPLVLLEAPGLEVFVIGVGAMLVPVMPTRKC